MAVRTKCQTPGAQFHTEITEDQATVRVEFGKKVPLSDYEAELLEINIHNALELVLQRFYANE